MSEQAPLDLRGLADVDSPEVVRAALRRFRRRILTRYVWVLLAVVVAALAVWWGRTPTTLQQRVDAASTAASSETVWHVKGLTVALDRVVDLGETVGLHFIVIPDDRLARSGHIEVIGMVASEGFGSWDEYLEVEPPPTGVPILTIQVGDRTERVPLDAAHAEIPSDFWR
jgi:hypothetical protein